MASFVADSRPAAVDGSGGQSAGAGEEPRASSFRRTRRGEEKGTAVPAAHATANEQSTGSKLVFEQNRPMTTESVRRRGATCACMWMSVIVTVACSCGRIVFFPWRVFKAFVVSAFPPPHRLHPRPCCLGAIRFFCCVHKREVLSLSALLRHVCFADVLCGPSPAVSFSPPRGFLVPVPNRRPPFCHSVNPARRLLRVPWAPLTLLLHLDLLTTLPPRTARGRRGQERARGVRRKEKIQGSS